MNDYKTITDYISNPSDLYTKAHLELIEKQAKLLESMTKPTVTVTEKTLRDEFAMAALTGCLAGRNNNFERKEWAEAAYELADAMMEARK